MVEQMTLESIVANWQKVVFTQFEGPPACIELIDLREFKKLRSLVNDSFQVGECAPYKGKVDAETEFGDVTDVMLISLRTKFPPEQYAEKSSTHMLSIDDRKAWRDELIAELDAMAPR